MAQPVSHQPVFAATSSSLSGADHHRRPQPLRLRLSGRCRRSQEPLPGMSSHSNRHGQTLMPAGPQLHQGWLQDHESWVSAQGLWCAVHLRQGLQLHSVHHRRQIPTRQAPARQSAQADFESVYTLVPSVIQAHARSHWRCGFCWLSPRRPTYAPRSPGHSPGQLFHWLQNHSEPRFRRIRGNSIEYVKVSHWIGHPNFEMVRHDVVEPFLIEVDRESTWPIIKQD